jgi:hypothetical protein
MCPNIFVQTVPLLIRLKDTLLQIWRRDYGLTRIEGRKKLELEVWMNK